MLKKDGIFIDCSSWSVNGPITLSNLWFEYGLSSNQIRTNDVRNVVLLVVDLSSIHHYIFWVWPMLSPCSHDGGSPVIWKFRWVVVEPISSILSPPWFLLNINLVLKTCKLCLLAPFMKLMLGWKKWLPRIHVHLVQVAAVSSRKIVFIPLVPSQVSHARAKYAMVWQARNLHSICIP